MRFYALFCCVAFYRSVNCYDFVTKYIEMPLDHFSFTSNATFKLRYLVNDTYFRQPSPVFFYTGNEGDISMFAQNTGFLFDSAPEFKALIVFAEHRYYGTSLPFGNLSYSSPSHLGYLSSQQALADYVYLINDLQKQYAIGDGQKLPVVAFGGSYGGMLSSWLRIKYPYAVIGAIASSAPIFQFKGITPCHTFYKIVTDVFRNLGSEKCEKTIRKSWTTIRNVAKDDNGRANVSSILRLCSIVKSVDDLNVLLDWMSEIYTNLAMVNYPYPADFLMPLPGNPIRVFCNTLDSVEYHDDLGLIKAIGTALEIYTNYTQQTKCNDIETTATADLGEKGWNFQSCTDMIMPICSTDEDMFENTPYNFTEYSEKCFKEYSVRPRNENVPILEYGGDDLETASNIVFSNGLLDPWSGGGVLKNISSKVTAVLMPDGAHHSDLRAKNHLDTEDVVNARNFHKKQIASWLGQYYWRYYGNNEYHLNYALKYKH
ncbi:lysosomal Pro-X carboxypeptidase [Cylas formicarius]|uniref:lysosomal Pro-X carboxypeptidase n=1 Tax=Cylas formicarius TaxID=197179 RepID=UPI002958D889|nr:lysosomal Pro-X carboxypeptidase [Cylas formicarius]